MGSGGRQKDHPSRGGCDLWGTAQMSNLQMIEELCRLVELQNEIIRKQAEALEQLDAVCCIEERARVRELAGRFCRDDG